MVEQISTCRLWMCPGGTWRPWKANTRAGSWLGDHCTPGSQWSTWKLTRVWPSLCCACIALHCAVTAFSYKNKFHCLKWENFLWMGSAQCAAHGLEIHEKQNHLEFHRFLTLSILSCPCGASSNKLDFLSFLLTEIITDQHVLEQNRAKFGISISSQNASWNVVQKIVLNPVDCP